QLLSVLYKEGQTVAAGALLAEIDPRPFQVQLEQAEGQLARDQALLTNAALDLQRFRTLAAQDSIATQQVDTQASLVRQFEGAVNQIDQTTGTLRLKAQFDNARPRLFPNQFVNARLLIDVKRGAVVVPAVAVQRSTRGTFVFVVKPDRTVTARPVTVSVTDRDDIVVEKGLAAGDAVVVDGVDRLREGARVSPS